MSKSTQSSHARAVTTFESLVLTCESFADYRPERAELGVVALRELLVAAQHAMDEYRGAEAAKRQAVAAREHGYELLSKRVTRAHAALRASVSSANLDERVGSVVRLIQGRHLANGGKTKPLANGTVEATSEFRSVGAADVELETPRTVSGSHMSYDARHSNFDQFVQILESTAPYAPSDTELSVAGLRQFYLDLGALNSGVLGTDAGLARARANRDAILYDLEKGVAGRAADCKAYVLSHYGSDSPEFRRISKHSLRH